MSARAARARGLREGELDEREIPLSCVYVSRSVDQGATWSPPRRLTSGLRDAKQDVNELADAIMERLAERLAVDLLVRPLASEPVDGYLVTDAGSFFFLFPSRNETSSD